MFGVFVVAQFWAFAADLYSEARGRRLIPLVAIGATAGAACGSWLTDQLVGSGLLSTDYLLMVALIPLAASIRLTRIVDARGPIGSGHETRCRLPHKNRRDTARCPSCSAIVIC